MISEQLTVWTIGHSNLTGDDFMGLLRQHAIEMLVDIRRFPGSRKHPQFGQESLWASLAERGIGYHWLETLGGRRSAVEGAGRDNSGWQNASFRNYADYMLTDSFRNAVDELAGFARAQKTAIMCSESVFWRCHRRLVSDYVTAAGGHVEHIFPNGISKPHTLTSFAVIASDDPLQLAYPGNPTLFVE